MSAECQCATTLSVHRDVNCYHCLSISGVVFKYHRSQSVYLPEATRYIASITLWSQKDKSRKEYHIHTVDHEGPGESDQDHCRNTGTRVTALVAKRANESHDLSSCHHRVDGKGVHILVGNIS